MYTLSSLFVVGYRGISPWGECIIDRVMDKFPRFILFLAGCARGCSSLEERFWDHDGSRAFQASCVLFGNRRYPCMQPGTRGSSRSKADPLPACPSAVQIHSSRYGRCRKNDTSRRCCAFPDDDRFPYTWRWPSLPSCEREEIPHQLVFHLQAIIFRFGKPQLALVTPDLVFARQLIVFPGPSFGKRGMSSARFLSRWLYRLTQSFIYLSANPNASALSFLSHFYDDCFVIFLTFVLT